MNRKHGLAAFFAIAIAPAAFANYTVKMYSIDARGQDASVGSIHVAANPKGGVVLTPDLKGLPPGDHGFHIHEKDNCSAMEKDGKLEPGEGAGPHFDPNKTHKHGGPAGGDNYSDDPKPNGGGGARIACGMVQAGEK